MWTRQKKFPYKFVDLPTWDAEKNSYQWKEFEICVQEDDPLRVCRGRSLMSKSLKRGDLIPFGGEVITQKLAFNRQRKKGGVKVSYIVQADQDFEQKHILFLDGFKLTTMFNGTAPAMFANEASLPGDLYNAQIVLIKRSLYTDMPDYPGIPTASEMPILPFLEIMGDIPCEGSRASRGTKEVLVFYDKYKSRPSLNQKNFGYTPKPICKDNLANSECVIIFFIFI